MQPANKDSYQLLIRAYLAQGKLDVAKTELEALAKSQPRLVGVQTMLGMISDIQGRKNEAVEQYVRVLELDPEAPVAANNLAWIYAERGENLDEALRLAEIAAAKMPEHADVQDTIGWIYYKKRLPALAIPRFERSVAANPKNPQYQYRLALAYNDAGQTKKAREAVDRALSLNPKFADAQAAEKLRASLAQ